MTFCPTQLIEILVEITEAGFRQQKLKVGTRNSHTKKYLFRPESNMQQPTNCSSRDMTTKNLLIPTADTWHFVVSSTFKTWLNYFLMAICLVWFNFQRRPLSQKCIVLADICSALVINVICVVLMSQVFAWKKQQMW